MHTEPLLAPKLYTVTVRAKARNESIKKLSSNAFDISVKEPKEGNRANKRIREILADAFGVSLSQVTIVKGHRSHSKTLLVR